MTSQDYDYDDDIDQQDEVPEPKQPSWRRRLEKDRDTFKGEAAALKRENAFLKAGVDMDDPKAKWFLKGYDGEIDAAAIKAAATEAGLIGAPVDTSVKDEVPQEEKDALARISDQSAGGNGAGGRDFNAEMRDAPDEATFRRVAREAGVRFADGVVDPPTNR